MRLTERERESGRAAIIIIVIIIYYYTRTYFKQYTQSINLNTKSNPPLLPSHYKLNSLQGPIFLSLF